MRPFNEGWVFFLSVFFLLKKREKNFRGKKWKDFHFYTQTSRRYQNFSDETWLRAKSLLQVLRTVTWQFFWASLDPVSQFSQTTQSNPVQSFIIGTNQKSDWESHQTFNFWSFIRTHKTRKSTFQWLRQWAPVMFLVSTGWPF